MKKIISLVIVAVIMVLSLASCDIVNDLFEAVTEEDNKSGDKSSDVGSESNQEPGEEDGTGNIADNTEELRTTITENEWEALDDIMNYTAKLTFPDHYKTEDGKFGECEVTQTTKQTKNAGYVERVSKYDYGETEIDEYLYVLKDDVSYELYESDDGTWYASKYSWKPDSLFEYLIAYGSGIDFDDLTYDEDKKAYTYTTTEDDIDITFTYHFKDSVLAKIEQKAVGDVNGERREMTVTATISNIGTTEITVPEYTIETFGDNT